MFGAACAFGCDGTRDVADEATAIEGDVADAVKGNVELAGEPKTGESPSSDEAAQAHRADSAQSNDKGDPHTKGAPKGAAGDSDDGVKNLCADYDSCNGCIAGLKADGDSAKGANAKCKLAVAGCWTTWDKPIDCDGEVIDEKPS